MRGLATGNSSEHTFQSPYPLKYPLNKLTISLQVFELMRLSESVFVASQVGDTGSSPVGTTNLEAPEFNNLGAFPSAEMDPKMVPAE